MAEYTDERPCYDPVIHGDYVHLHRTSASCHSRIRELTEPTVRETADELSDHVILCGYSDFCATLVEDFDIVEFRVHRESDLCGKNLSECKMLEQTRARLLGGWIHGEFVTSPSDDEHVDENTVLVFTGTESQSEEVLNRTYSHHYRSVYEPVIIADHGLVGKTANGILTKADLQSIVVDSDSEEHVDVSGDATGKIRFTKLVLKLLA